MLSSKIKKKMKLDGLHKVKAKRSNGINKNKMSKYTYYVPSTKYRVLQIWRLM